MEEEALKLADESDIYAAVEYLMEQDDLVAAVRTLNSLQRKAYWERKNIGQCVAFGRAGLQLGLTEGRRAARSNPELAEQLLGQAKAIAYNLATFTWPGWDEPGIELSASDVAMGLDAAKVNLRLAVELKRDAGPMGKAHWALGAHYLAAENLTCARMHFEQARKYAHETGTTAEGHLADGYLLITDLIAAPDDRHLESDLAGIQEQLKPLKDGEFFIDQLKTARKIFCT